MSDGLCGISERYMGQVLSLINKLSSVANEVCTRADCILHNTFFICYPSLAEHLY